MTAFRVEIEQISTGRKSYADAELSEDYYTNIFKNIKINDKSYDVVSSLDFAPADKVFVVWVEYSTGDSFNHRYKGETITCGVFKDPKAALAFKKFIENKNTKEYREIFKSPDGQEIEIYRTWLGHFETLEEIHIEETRIW